ncbi:MAG: hypothetical protein LBH35_10555, partial [Treponema sp.]|nr:hypothetical protein [Treponema sp.]
MSGACLLFFSCATTNPYEPVDRLVEAEAFSQSVEVLEENSKKIYREKDQVLYYLDKGMLSHYAEDWNGSASLLERGERAIEENFAVSISQEIGVYLLNDLSREYDGEDYEDVYLNVFNALNYYHRGKNGETSLDEALVEIRRINNKLKDLSVKYGAMISALQAEALKSNTEIPANPSSPREFSNSALARYLGMLFYRGEGAMDDARIDRDGLKLAFADYPGVYSHPVPSSINEELEIPPGMARLNVLGFCGRLPLKTEETMRIPIGVNWIKIVLPVLTPLPSRVGSAQVVFDGGERFDLELLEDTGKVAETAFTRKQNVIYLRTVIRATVKGVTAAVFGAAARNSDSDENGALFSILSLGTQIFAEASEKADLRSA